MKKDIPNTIKIEFPYDPESIEGLMLFRYDRIIEEGHTFSIHDFDLFCAIIIRKHGLEKIHESILKYAIENENIRPEIQFQMTALALELGEEIDEQELKAHAKARIVRVIKRKETVKKEIQRTGINAKKVTLNNTSYYRELLTLIKGFNDLTLIDWFVPIVLTFKKFVHIYVKHVEETKFGDGQFKRRSYFDYKYTEILNLLKAILKQEEQSIKDHFLEVVVGRTMKNESKIKDYHRGFRKFTPIVFGGDEFRLTIDKNGFIQSFYQKK